jgi:biotin carboxylase
VHDGKPHVIDLAAVICGGSFGAREIPLCTGVDFLGAAIRLAVGDCVFAHELQPRSATPVVRRYIFPEPGRIVSISGVEDARAVPGIAEVVITASLGDIVPRANDKRPSAVTLLASAASQNDALSAANEALAQIQIVTE